MTDRTGKGVSRETEQEEARIRERFSHALAEQARHLALPVSPRTDQLRGSESQGRYLRFWRAVIRRGAAVGVAFGLAATAFALVEWNSGGAWLRSETINGVRPTPLLTGVMMLLIGTAIVSLIRTPVPPWRRRIADLAAGAVCVLAVIGTGTLLVLGDPVAWKESGFFRDPSFAAFLLATLLGVALLAVDRTRPDSRFDSRIVLAIGIVAEVGVLSRGYRIPAVSETIALDFSLAGLAGGIGLIFAFLTLRPDRGFAGFMGSTGAGPAMARLLAPVVLAIPFALIIGRELTGFAMSGSSQLIWLVDEILVVTALILIVTYASRRLQEYFEDWRQAADELGEQASVLATMAEGVAMLGLEDERVILTNPQFDRMHGYSPGDLVGESIHVIRPEDSSPEEVRDWGRVSRELLDHGTSQFETRTRRRDGSVIWCRTNSLLADHPKHGPVMIMVRTDVTAEREAMIAGAAAEARFRQVFEQSPIGLALVRPDGGFERVNRTFEELTGYTDVELYGMTFGDITHPDDLDEDLRLTAAMFGGESDGFQMEKRYIRKDGGIVRVALSAVLLREDGEGSGVALSMVQDVTEPYELGRKLRFLAEHDPLTGLFNRRRFERELSETVTDLGGGSGRGIAVMLIDIDNFKFINDSHGHSIGDRLIVRTGEILRRRLRSGDVLARQGGDEFVMLLRDITSEDAPAVAADLVGAISAGARVDGGGSLARATASIGVVTSSALARTNPEELMRSADIAMYEAKDAGRNGFRVYSSRTSSAMVQGVDWHGRIREALDRDGFALYCQPLVSLKGDPAPGFELFLRLPGPDGRPISPSAFLPVAERNNLIGEIDHWVVRRAIRLLAESGPVAPSRLFVNLSGQSVGDLNLVSVIAEELGRTGVESKRLVFEVTETSAIADMERAMRFTSELTRIGCGTALDDFGAGFSSFYYLKHIPTDFVKIDGEFIRNLGDDPVSQQLVRSLAELSRNLGRQTVAEQVEDERTLNLLASYGVDLVQGFLSGRPRPATPQSLRYPASRDAVDVRLLG